MPVENIAVLIPIVAIIFGVSVAIVSIVTQSRRRVKEFEMRHRERMSAIERGLEVPPEPLDSVDGQRRPPRHEDYLLKGMIWAGVGIAILFFGDVVLDEVARLGAIPAAVGIAYLAFYFIAKPKDGQDKPGGPVTPA